MGRQKGGKGDAEVLPMIIGHYATALYPYSRHKVVPLWVFLLCSNLSDFLWLFLAWIGIETPTPSSALEATFQNIQVQMAYSHDAVPVLLLAVLTALVVFLFYQDRNAALWCGALVPIHFLSDLLVGYEHHLMGEGSLSLGLNLYQKAPHLSLVIEAAFAAFCVFLYFWSETKQGRTYSWKHRFLLYAVFIGGSLVWLPTATVPLGRLFF